MSDAPARKRRASFVALIAPTAIIILATILSIGVNDRFQTELLDRFREDADDALHIATMRLDSHRDFMYSGRALVMSGDPVPLAKWRTFYNQQSMFARYPGISSVSYVKNVPTAELSAFEAQMRSNDYFGPSYKLKEMSKRSNHALVSTYLSQNDMSAVIGMDLTRLDDRYEVYRTAEAKNEVIASPPFKLATGFEGFFSVLPVMKAGNLDGYILQSYRFEELMPYLFDNKMFDYKVTDITDTKPVSLFASSGFDSTGYQSTKIVDVGSRKWEVVITQQAEKRPVGFLLPQAIVATAVVLATAVYLIPQSRYRRR